MNRIQIRRTSTPGNVPTLSQLLEGELALNLVDKNLFVSTGSQVYQINSAENIVTDENHRFTTDAQLAQAREVATVSSIGLVKIGNNIDVDANGSISLKTSSAASTGVLTSSDWSTFSGKQDALGYVPVDKAGDTMTGTLTLSGAPVAANDAANKGYVDTGLSEKVDLNGATMFGLLVLSSDPEQSLGAATKQYVDNSVSTVTGTYAAPVQSLANLSGTPALLRQDKQLRLVEDTGAIFRFDAQSLVLGDGNGVITPDDNPTAGRWFKVSSATQNHEMLTGVQGGAADDHLHLTTAEKNGYDSHLADTTIHLTSDQHTFITSLNATAGEINYLVGTTSLVQTQLDAKQATIGYTPLNLAGDTMTGLLLLSGDPTEAMGAVTRQYLESYVVDGGTF